MKVCVAVCALLVFVNTVSAEDAKTWKPCNSGGNEISLNACLKKNLEKAIQNFEQDSNNNGNESLDPLVLNTINLGHNSVKLRLKGIKDTKVEAFMMDINQCKIYAETISSTLKREGEFLSPTGNYVVPINEGSSKNDTLEDIKIIHIVECQKYKREGVEHLKITKYSVLLKPDTVLSKLNKLLVGNSQVIKKDIETNDKAKLENLKKSGEVEYKLGLILTAVINEKLKNLPLNLIIA